MKMPEKWNSRNISPFSEMKHMKIPLIVFIAIKRYPGEKAAGGIRKVGRGAMKRRDRAF